MNIGSETEIIEFKKSTSELKEGVISLSAMLNKSNHGILYFGVKDKGDVVGQQIGDRTLRDVSQAIADNLKPQVIPTITLELMDNKNVIKVVVYGSDKPYSAYGRYYMRSIDEDRELSPNQLKELMLNKEYSDEILNIPASKQNLKFTQLKSLMLANDKTVIEDTFETNMSLKNKQGMYNLMAELLSDNNDISIKVVVFEGENKSKMLKRNEYGNKCLALAMDQASKYIESLNETFVDMSRQQREDEKLFDYNCFMEAWKNACIHNKWSKLNPPAIYVFSDRIEIISTGGLPVDMSKDEFYKGISKPVNKKLQTICAQVGFGEQTGHGNQLIVAKYGIQAFDIMDNFINVTIPFSKKKEIKKHIDLSNVLNENQEKLYNLLADKPQITIVEMVTELGLSDGYVRKLINQLKEKGLIKHVGSFKKGYWEVSHIQ